MPRRIACNPGEMELARERLRLTWVPPQGARPVRTPGELLPAVLGKAGLGAAFQAHRMLGAWPEVVGAQVARQTRPGRLEQGTLTVFVRHSIWLHELSRFGKEQMLERLRECFGKNIRRLRLQLDPEPERYETGV